MDERKPLCFRRRNAILYSFLALLTFLPTIESQFLSQPQDRCTFDWECPQDSCCMADIRTVNHVLRHCVRNVGPSSVCGRPRHCTSKFNEGCGPYQGFQCQNFNPNPPLPYYGECRAPPNPCLSSPCLNRGICIALDNYRFFCQCPSPTFGPQCQFLPQPAYFPPYRPQTPMYPTYPLYPTYPSYPAAPQYPQFQRPDIPIAQPLDEETGSGDCSLCKNNAVCNLDSTPICQCKSGFTGEFCDTSATN